MRMHIVVYAAIALLAALWTRGLIEQIGSVAATLLYLVFTLLLVGAIALIRPRRQHYHPGLGWQAVKRPHGTQPRVRATAALLGVVLCLGWSFGVEPVAAATQWAIAALSRPPAALPAAPDAQPPREALAQSPAPATAEATAEQVAVVAPQPAQASPAINAETQPAERTEQRATKRRHVRRDRPRREANRGVRPLSFGFWNQDFFAYQRRR